MGILQIEDFLGYRFLSDLDLSPDKSKLGFVTHRADWDENRYRSHIWLYDIPTQTSRRLTAVGEEKKFLWLDDDTILFAAVRDEETKKRIAQGEQWTVFYTIGIHGGEAAEAFRVPLQVSAARRLPNGDYLFKAAYDHLCPQLSSPEEAQRATALERKREEADYQVLDELPFWMDGGTFVNKIRQVLFYYSAETGAVRPITDVLANVGGFAVREQKVVYAANRYADVNTGFDGLYQCDLATGETAQLLESDVFSIKLVDFIGERLCFFGSTLTPYGTCQNADYYELRGGEAKLLARCDFNLGSTVGSDCRLGGGNLSGLGTHRVEGEDIYVAATVDHCSCVRRISPDGKMEDVTVPKGSVDSFAVAPGGVYFAGMRGQQLQELYFSAAQSEWRLTGVNETALAHKEISPPEHFLFESGGLELDGFVLKPTGYDPNEKYPAILEIHGGPKTVYSDVFFHEMQCMANAGYFVIFCNPRGSDGRGDVFADLKGKFGTIDYDDIMRFVDVALERHPQIDRDRVGVTGGSYGGFMTNWIIGHTNRFACAVSQRSITNFLSMFGISDIGYDFTTDLIGNPWQDIEKVWFHSPMRYADQVKTPTLFIHSDEDYRCPLAEGIQMFSALKFHGVESRLCMFKGENHDLSRSGKPRHRVRRLREILGWFDAHLKK